MKRILVSMLVAAAAMLLLGTLLMRSPFVSDALTELTVAEISEVLGTRVEVDRTYVNIIPFFVAAEGIRIPAERSGDYSVISKIKAYIGLSGLLNKEVVLKRIVIIGADIHASDKDIERFRRNIREYLLRPTKSPVQVIVRAVVIHNSSATLATEVLDVHMKGLNAEFALADVVKGTVALLSVKAAVAGGDPVEGRIKAAFVLRDDMIELREMNLLTSGSSARAWGSVAAEQLRGMVGLELDVVMHEIKRMLGLKGGGDGRVAVRGKIDLQGESTEVVDAMILRLETKGDLLLETLMEVLRVEEPLRGHVSFVGRVEGTLRDLSGEGRAVLSAGHLFGVKIERLETSIQYRKGRMRFSDASGSLYGGSARAEAEISLPVVDNFNLAVTASDLDSKGVFELISWDPMIPEGRVSGVLESSGAVFSPKGSFSYKSTSQGADILGRIREVTGSYSLKDDVVTLRQLRVVTAESGALAEGDVDLRRQRIVFAGEAATTDMRDLSAPYFEGLRGAGRISFAVRGMLKDPEIDASFETAAATLDTTSLGIALVQSGTLRIESMTGDVTYGKSRLVVRRSSVSMKSGGKIAAVGRIGFPKAQELFQLKDPLYDLAVNAKDFSLQELGPLIKGSILQDGVVTSDVAFRGSADHPIVKGDVIAASILFRGANNTVDRMRGTVSLDESGSWAVKEGRVSAGISEIRFTGRLDASRVFSMEMSSKKLRTSDIVALLPFKKRDYPFLKEAYVGNIRVIGDGTIDNPSFSFWGEALSEADSASFLGRGAVEGRLRNNILSLSAILLDNKLRIRGSASLTGSTPWSFSIDARKARYDRLVKGFFREAPDDLLLSAEGTVMGRGDRDHVNLDASLENVYIYLYGNGFSSSAPIVAQLRDRNLTISRTTLRNNDTELSVSGDMIIGKSLNLSFEGASALEPARAFWKQIEVLRGRASYVLSVTGDWNRPSVNGGIEIAGGVLGVKGVPYRVTDLSAYCYFDEDTLVLQNAKGRVSGGDIRIAGTASIQRFSLKKFSLEADIGNVALSPRRDLWINLNGSLFYRGTPDSQTLSGDISVNKAKYTERIDWRSWILSARTTERPAGELTKIDMTNLNVRVNAPSVVVDNNLARASVALDLVLRGTIGRPIPLGKLEISDGIVYFRNNEFTLRKGRVDFSNPNRINPYVDVIAETKVDLYSVRLSLSGTPDDFSLALDSTPSLPEADIFSLLAVGYVDSKSKGIASGLGAAEASAFLAGKLQDTMDDRLRSVVGLDRIQVEPYVTKKTATATPRLSVSKRLFGEDLYLTYATTLDTGAEQVWKVEYRVGRHVALIGIRDERGGLGGDVRFRFSFK